MSVLLMESFDGVATEAQLDVAPKWIAGGAGTIVAGGHTGQGLQSTAWRGQHLVSDTPSLYCGLWFRLPTGTTPSDSAGVQRFLQTGYNNEALDSCALVITAARLVAVRVGSTNVATAAAPTALALDTWYFLELGCTIGAAGIITARINGIQVASFSGETRPDAGGPSTFSELTVLRGMTGSFQGAGPIIDDLYLTDSGFLGVSEVQCIRPSGDGASSGWVNSASTSVNNYSYIDEQSVDDADYVQAFGDGDKDTYVFGDVSAVATHAVQAVQVTTRAAWVDVAKDIAHVHRLGAVEADSADITLSNALTNVSSVRETDPNGDPWTFANVNAAEWGIKQRPV